MNGESELPRELAVAESRNVDTFHSEQSDMGVSQLGVIPDIAPTQVTEGNEIVQLRYSAKTCCQRQHHRPHETMLTGTEEIEGEGYRCQEQHRGCPPSFLRQPLSFIWRRLKWGLILSLGRNDSVVRMNDKDMKAAVATQLEVAIMGSALVLTLCLQIQEVVGSRGGFTLPEHESARFVFVLSAALSFSFAFYSIITSATMLLSINAIPQDSAERFWTTLSCWSAIPRLCTLAGAFCLGITALTAYLLGLENSAAWVGVAVMASAILLTIASTVIILVRSKRLQEKVWEEVRDSTSANCVDPRVDVENVSFQRKHPDTSDPSLTSPVAAPVLTPLSSLTNTTSFSIGTSRFRQ